MKLLKSILLLLFIGQLNAQSDFIEIQDKASLVERVDFARGKFQRLVGTIKHDSLNLAKAEFKRLTFLENSNTNVARYYYAIGNMYFTTNNIDSSLYYYKKCINQITDAEASDFDWGIKILSLIKIGEINSSRLYMPAKAIEYLEEAIILSEKHRYPGYRLFAYRDLCKIYENQGDFKTAIELAQEGIDENKFMKLIGFGGEKFHYHRLNDILAILYAKCESCQKKDIGFRLLSESLLYYRKEGYKKEEAIILANLAALYYNELGSIKAKNFINRALELSTNFDIQYMDTHINELYAKYLYKNRNYEESVKILNHLLSKVDTCNIHSLSNIYKMTSEVYEEKGDYKKAIDAFKKHVSYKLNIKDKYNSQSVLALQAKMDLERKERLTTIFKERSEMITKYAMASIALLLLSAIFLIVIIVSRRKLSQKNKELEIINKAKSDLFVILAHDLKGPILSFDNLASKVSYLLKNENYLGLEKLTKYITEISQSVKSTVSNLLDWSISQKDNFSLIKEHIDLSDALTEVAQDLNYIMADKKVKLLLEMGGEESIFCDRNSFTIIYRNLIHNAIKYSNNGSEVKVVVNETGSKTNIKVINESNEVGNEMQRINNILGSKKDIITYDLKTSGIGLHTAIKLIKHNNGDISFQSLNGKVVATTSFSSAS